MAQGFDVKETPLNDGSIWALQTVEGKRFARVNTDLSELDTVKAVIDPTELVQTQSSVLVVAESNNKLANVSLSTPTDIKSDSPNLQETPSGTQQVFSNDEYVAYLTADGDIYTAPISNGASTMSIDPYAADEVKDGEDRRHFVSTAVALTPSNVLYAFSTTDETIMRFDVVTGKLLGQESVKDVSADVEPTLTVVGDTWVLLDGKTGQLLSNGFTGVETGIEGGGVLQKPSAAGDRVFVSGIDGLESFALGSGERRDEFAGTGLGTPAPPATFDGQTWAAWLGADSGTLWSSASGDQPLEYNGKPLPGDADPAFRGNGARMILNDTSSGWVWKIPDATIVPSSQDWTFGITEDEQTEQDAEQAKELVEAAPPVAVDDDFGVRAGQLVTLPVLMNDHDPNKDVLTVLPESLAGLSASFGSLSVTTNNQAISVRVAPGAKGSATFTYLVTDGTRKNGLYSKKPATVRLTVHDDKSNEAPRWCVENGCQQDWFDDNPVQVRPGGSATVRVLDNWVDPDGDPLFVKSVRKKDPKQVGKVASTPDGTVVFQHPNPNGTASGTVNLTVLVSDTKGKSTERNLPISITGSPRLSAVPFAVSTRAGEPITIDPAPHLTGVSGTFAVTAASTGTEDGSKVALREGSSTFDFRAKNPGDYIVTYTVEDESSKLVAAVRVTVIANNDVRLTTSPVTIFLRPRLDSTVDVFSAVSNPAGKVLLLTEAVTKRVNNANLDVNVVDHRLIRVKGSTRDGKPGTVGTVEYTLSDGTGNAQSQVKGVATVILLAAPAPQAPIAVDDAVTVRAGAQVDIPVLDNDVSGDGNAMVLNPDELRKSSKLGLAFTAGSIIRYLAPTKSGTYRIAYGVYSAGTPDVSDTATVVVTVLPGGDNRAPQPKTLTGRVLAGETVSIPFSGNQLDPDGDAVVLDRIVKQPASGTATIALGANAIVYSSVSGYKGPVEFSYSVKDALGKVATATVRVGVLEDQSDPSPVTFSDYVEVQVGESNVIDVYPASNDVEPAGKALTLMSVQPDASKGDAIGYAALKKLVGPIRKNGVKLYAGDSLGTKTFEYQIKNSTGDTAFGYITMKVVREAVPDRPQVSDTYVSLADRSTFSSGIDVVTGKVSWLSGDVSKLSLSLWGDTPGVSLDGLRIKGALPAKTILVPFKLSGKNFFGTTVSTYGFLQVPGKDDIILALGGDPTQNVKENAAVTFDMASLMSIPKGETLLVGGKSFTTTKQRTAATCTLEAGTKITYTAGRGEPWTDSCRVPVKLAGQPEFTTLLVPIAVEPGVPQPRLRPASLTISPGTGPVSYNLRSMTEWRGKEDWASVQYKASYKGNQFRLVQKGEKLTIEAIDTASPGQVEAVTVTLTSHKDVAPSRITLKVGPAPTDLPRGARVDGTCSADKGTSCVIKVIGKPGEFNIYDNTPLKLVSVDHTSSCVGVTFGVDGDSIRARYTQRVAGATCKVSFVVRDAQKNTSAGEGNGQLTLDLHGYPLAPDAVQQVTYADHKLSVGVSPGDAQSAYPKITGFVIKDKSKTVAKCDTSGACAQITGLENGDKRTYDAYAVNSVGESLDSVRVIAWSYAKPVLGQVTRTAIFSNQTTRQRGVVEVEIVGTDSSVDHYEITGVDHPVTRTGGRTVERFGMDVGDRTITVKPISKIDIPKGTGEVAEGEDGTVHVAGLPAISDISVFAESDRMTVSGANLDTNNSAKPSEVLYLAYFGNANCSIRSDGGGLTASFSNDGSVTSSSPVISGLQRFQQYKVMVCASNGFGLTQTNVVEKITWGNPGTPQGWTYSVGDLSGGRYTASINYDSGVVPNDNIVARFNKDRSEIFAGSPGFQVRYCSKYRQYDENYCGDWKDIDPADGHRAWQMRVFVEDKLDWICGQAPVVRTGGDVAGNASSAVTGEWYDALGEKIASPSGAMPPGAVEIRNGKVTVTWTTPSVSSFAPYVQNISDQKTCQPPDGNG